MDAKKIEKLKALGDVGVTGSEIAEVHEKVAASANPCQHICEWFLKKMVAKGSCAAGFAALDGLSVIADIVFIEFDEILVPLEAAIEVAWGVTCAEIGVAAIGKEADKLAAEICSKI